MKFQKEYQVFSKSNTENLKSDKMVPSKFWVENYFQPLRKQNKTKKRKDHYAVLAGLQLIEIYLYLPLLNVRLKVIHL